jgi:hypothetical protein
MTKHAQSAGVYTQTYRDIEDVPAEDQTQVTAPEAQSLKRCAYEYIGEIAT